MNLTMDAMIERRLLVNWRADPTIVAPLVPHPFRPQVVNGAAVVGICFVRLAQLRPRRVPTALGLRSESAAHRIAVERDTPHGPEAAVFILRRVTDSRAAVAAGGWLFPGVHAGATFDVHETDGQLDIAFETRDGTHDASVSARAGSDLNSQLFSDVDAPASFVPRRSGGRRVGAARRSKASNLPLKRGP